MNRTKPSSVLKNNNGGCSRFFSGLMTVPKIFSFQISREESELTGELESVECDLSGQTYENKCFKKKSSIEEDNPLTYVSVKKSIWNEMKSCGGRTDLLCDANITRDNINWKLNKASQEEINIMLLWSALHKRYYLFEHLIAMRSDPCYFEKVHGLSALHVCAFVGCVPGTNFMIKCVKDLNIINKWYSALHCAAIGKEVETAKLLLDNGAKLNSMANGPSYETPLFVAVDADAVDCVQLFIERGAQLHQEGKLSDFSPFFRAAELGHTGCLEIMLNMKKLSCTKIRKGDSGNTILHVAAENGHSHCIEAILQKGVNPNLINNNSQTPLHLAVKTNSCRCVEVLLYKGKADPNLKDSNHKTALHAVLELVSDSRRDIVNVLLRNGADVNATDLHGFTPLHTAALNELTQCVLILISHGADMSIKSKSGITAFGLVARKTPAALTAIKNKLSEFITLVHAPESLNDIEIQFNFKSGLHHPKEYSLLNTFIEEGQQDILLHPFCTAFLYVTWCRIRRCYYGIIFTTFMFSLCLLFYLLTALAQDCARRAVNAHLINETAPCYEDSFLNNVLSNSPLALETQWYILLYFAICLIYRKIYGLRGYLSLKDYFANIGNVFEWISIFSVFLISFLYTGKVESWQIHSGAFALMFAWTNMMFLVGQLPMFGPYVEMFHKVLNEFFKLLLVYSSLLIGYTVSFCIFFPNTSAFANPVIGFLTVLVMMTGDMNFDILLDYNNEESSSYLAKPGAQIMYTFFLVFVSIVLMNLLVGIAVHDIQGLQKTADLTRLVRQTKLSSYIELSHYNQNKWVKCPMEMFKFVPKPYIGVLKVKPLDPLEIKLPKDILQAAYELVKKRHSSKTLSNQVSDAAVNWRKLCRRTEYDLKNRNPMNKLFNKLEGYFTQIDTMRIDLKDLKGLIQSTTSENRRNVF